MKEKHTMAKQQDGYLSAKESRRISKENRRITDQYEKRASARMCRNLSTPPR